MPSACSTRAAWMPSQVEAILISTRSRGTPAAWYRAIRPRARFDHGARVEGQARIHLGGDPARYDIEDLAAERDQQAVGDLGRRGALVRARRLDQQQPVRLLLHGLEDQRGVGGGVGGAQRTHRFEIAGIGNDNGMAAQRFELAGHKANLSGQ